MTSKTWNGSAGEWNTGSDWSPSGAPANSDAATLGSGTLNIGTSDGSVTDYSAVSQTLSVTGGALTVYSFGELQLDGLSVSGSGSVTVNGGSLYTGVSGQGGTVFAQSGNITVTNNGTLTVGGYITGAVSGTVALTAGGSYDYQDTQASSTSGNIVNFAAGGGTFNDQAAWGGTIQNFNTSNSNSIGFAAQISSFSYATGTKLLTVHLAGGTTYTLKFTDNATALTQANFSDTGNPYAITYTGAPYQQISAAAYNAATGALTVSGHGFTTAAGDYNVTALTISGEYNSTYTLTSGSTVAANPTSTGFTVNLSAADQLAVDGLLDANGTTAQDGTAFGLSATANFDTGGTASNNAAITTSNAVVPTITAVAYNSSTGVLTLTGTHFENDGQYGGINLGQITLKGGSNQTFTFNANDYGSAVSATQVSIDLSNTNSSNGQSVASGEEASVNALFNKAGTSSTAGTAYNLAATSGWDSGAGAAITAQAVTVSTGAVQPAISSASYDAGTGRLTVTGTNLTTSASDYTITDLSVSATAGTYPLISSSDAISGTPTSTSFVVQLDATDQSTVDAFLNSGGTRTLSAAAGFDTPSGTASSGTITLLDSGSGPSIGATGGTTPSILTSQSAAVAVENGTVTVTGSPDVAGIYAGGTFTASISANDDSTHDKLSIINTAGGITTSGATTASTVSYNGTAIGTIAATGAPGQSLSVTLNGSATDATIAALVKAIGISESGTTASTAQRQVNFAVTDAYGKSNATTTAAVTVLAPPTVTAIDRTSAMALTNATTDQFTVTFSQAVQGVNTGDFTVAGSGVSGTVGSVSGAGTTWTVTVNSVSGNGTLGLNQTSDNGVTATSGGAALTGTHNADQTYTVDQTAPIISGITLDHAAYGLGSTVTATISLSGSPDGNGAYVLANGSTIDGATLTGATYNSAANTITGRFTVSGSTTEVINGAVAANVTVDDAAGNGSTADTTAITGVTVDTHAPTAVSVAGFTNGATDTGTSDIAAGATVGTLSTTDASVGDSFTYTLGGAAAGSFTIAGSTLKVGSTALSSGQTYNVTITSHDLGGNTDTQAVAVTGASVPTVTSIDRAGASATTNAASDPFTVTFSEAVSGVTAANFTLTGTDGTGTVGTPVTSNSGLTWTVPVTGVSGNGTLGLDLTSTAGITSTSTGTALGSTHASDQTYTIDTTAPTVAGLSDVTSTGTADLKAGATVTFTLTGSEALTVAPTAVLTLSNGASATSTSGSGTTTPTFTYTVASADTNTADLTVTGYTGTITDLAGNALVAAGVTQDTGVQIDTTAPTVAGLGDVTSTGTADLKAGTTVTFTLTGSEALTVAPTAVLTLSNGASATSTSGSGTTTPTFTYTVASADTNTADLTVTGYAGTITDLAGNALVAAGVTEDTGVQIDTAAPAAPSGLADAAVVNGSVDAATDTAAQTLTGTAEAGSTVTVSDGATVLGTTVATNAGGFSYVLGHLADGSHSLTATATDAAGNTGGASAALSFTVDTVAPAAPSVVLAHDTGSSATDGITSDPTITSTPSAPGDTLLYKADGAASYGTTAPVFATNGTADGPHTVSVEEEDAAGNISAPASLAFTLDTTAPTVAITAPASGAAVAIIDPTIMGTVDLADAGSTVALTAGGTALGSATVASDGTWSTALDLGTDGSYVVTASDTDVAGNTAQTSVTFAIDSTPNRNLFGSITQDVTSPGGQIYALYETILGRAPDPTGFENYVTDLDGGTSLTSLAESMLESPEYTGDYGPVSQSSDSAFITQLYADGLSRMPDPGGLQTYEAALSGGSQSRAQVAVDIATSPESQNDRAAVFQVGVFTPSTTDSDIARLYYGLLDRAPDATGLLNWEQAVAGGTTLNQVAQDFLGSAEYATTSIGQSNMQFIEQLYQSALGRSADPAGLQNDETALDTGSVTRGGTVSSVLGSAEFTADTAGDSTAAYITEVYQVALDRAPDPGGLQTYETAIANGMSRIAFNNIIVASPEFQANVTAPAQTAFIDTLYAQALGRAPDPGGVQTYTNQLANGAPLASVALNIIESPEAQNHLAPKIETGFHLV